MVRVDVRKLSNTLISAGVPEKRAVLLAKAFKDSINEIDPVSQSYVNKKIEKSKMKLFSICWHSWDYR